MKNKKLFLILITIAIIAVISTAVYAAYSFTKAPGDDDVDLGKISLTDKEFLVYDSNNVASEIELDANGDNEEYSVDNNVITVYATEKLGYDDELANTIYLNELGFQFTINNSIDVYARLHIQEAWISHKVYNNGTIVENYIRQDANAKASAYIKDENWMYDETTGYFYLKTKIESGESNSYAFRTSDTTAEEPYFYPITINKNYRESVFVELSFTVDIVQANRAQAKWGVDVDSLFTENQDTE